jgi:hypothetical protein
MQGFDRSNYCGTCKETEEVYVDREKETLTPSEPDLGLERNGGLSVSILFLALLMPEKRGVSCGVLKVGCQSEPSASADEPV